MIFKSLYYFYRIFWYPFFRLVLPLVNGKFRSRLQFEKSQSHIAFRSFKLDGEKADYAFECSSEGEFEQIIPLVNYLLGKNKKIELLYSSESVDHRCLDLFEKHSKLIRLYRLPLLSFFPKIVDPGCWITASEFYLCRYDFFPELIFYGRRAHVNFHLLWAMGKDSTWPLSSYYHWVYSSFNKIVAATIKDKLHFENAYQLDDKSLVAYDFRPIQIARRLSVRDKTLSSKFPSYEIYCKLMATYPKAKRLIFGSFWEYELQAFASSDVKELLANEGLVTIVPHDLSNSNIDKIKMGLKQLEILYYEISNEITAEHFEFMRQEMAHRPGVLLITLKGVLCELYWDYAMAFVGGGHGVSIHSVLEPYIAGNQIFCGPKVHRSTEYQFILGRNPERIQIIEDLNKLFPSFQEKLKLEYKQNMVDLDRYISDMESVLLWLGMK